jgi:hypothetical protein
MVELTYSAAVEPLSLIIALFESQWQTYGGRVPKPYVYIWNETPSPRMDLSKRDRATIQYESPAHTEEYEGVPHEYQNRFDNLKIELFTVTGRQRGLDVINEMKRILYANQHNAPATGFQWIRFKSFQESPESRRKNWKFEMRFSLENYGVVIDGIDLADF